MTFNISDFRSQVTGEQSRGISKQSNFDVVVNLPPGILMSERSQSAFNSLRFRIESADLPGRQIRTSEHKTHGYGLTSKIGYDVTYPDVSITMLCGADLGEKSFFQAWQSAVVGNHSRQSDIRAHQSLGYYNDYVSSVGIVQYDTKGVPKYSMALAEAFPVIINSLPLTWGSEDLHRLTVQFTYKHFTEVDEPPRGKGAPINKFNARLKFNIPNMDDQFEKYGLPRIGEIFNIPIFQQDQVTIKGSSTVKSILGF